jgi:hypothetical protein
VRYTLAQRLQVPGPVLYAEATFNKSNRLALANVLVSWPEMILEYVNAQAATKDYPKEAQQRRRYVI